MLPAPNQSINKMCSGTAYLRQCKPLPQIRNQKSSGVRIRISGTDPKMQWIHSLVSISHSIKFCKKRPVTKSPNMFYSAMVREGEKWSGIDIQDQFKSYLHLITSLLWTKPISICWRYCITNCILLIAYLYWSRSAHSHHHQNQRSTIHWSDPCYVSIHLLHNQSTATSSAVTYCYNADQSPIMG